MSGMAAFTSDKVYLSKLMELVADGRIQLPEFQRGWVWDDDHIRSLLASVSVSYPIGAIMLLQTGNDQVRFKPRPVEGVQLEQQIAPERFILDGQQRITSLYQALCLGQPVETNDTRGRPVKRWYYVRMTDAVHDDADREDAIVSLPEDRIVRSFRNEVLEDYSSPEAEYEHHIFPLSQVFSSADWRKKYNAYWQYDPAKIKLFDEFEEKVIKRFEQYLVPYIELVKESPKEAVCQVFEKVNTGGVPLSVFELMTATFAADEFDLRADWEGERDEKGHKTSSGRVGRLREQKVLGGVEATDFLQTVTLLTTHHRRTQTPDAPVSCKRAEVLKLELTDYTEWAEPATDGFTEAAKFLFQQKVFSKRDLPYGTQLVPLAAMFAILGDRADNDPVRQSIAKWYWCGVFGELYGSAVETRFARDLVEVLAWLGGGSEPSTIAESNFVPSRLLTLRTRNSAAYKGLYALLIRDGCLDFLSGKPIDVQTYFDEKIDIHHIFPRDYCKRQGIPSMLYDSVINKTAISAKTNRVIGGNAPSVYLHKLTAEKGIAPERLDQILLSHLIDPDALRRDDFEAFFTARQEALLLRIEAATGRRIARESEDEMPATLASDQLFEDEPEEDQQ